VADEAWKAVCGIIRLILFRWGIVDDTVWGMVGEALLELPSELLPLLFSELNFVLVLLLL